MKCRAKRTDGNPCKAWAVTGLKVCRVHGGSSPQSKAKRDRAKSEQQAAKSMRLFASPVEVDPGQALLDLVHWTAGEVEYWREQVRELAERNPEALTWGMVREKVGGEDNGTTLEAKPNINYVMLYAAQDRLEKYATAALRAGVAERQIKLAEDQGRVLVDVVKMVLDRLQITTAQREMVPTVVPEVIRMFASGGQISRGA